MTSRQISTWLVVVLAIIVAITAVGFIAGYYEEKTNEQRGND